MEFPVGSPLRVHYRGEFAIGGLTSNPAIFDHPIKNSKCLRQRNPSEENESLHLKIHDSFALFVPICDAKVSIEAAAYLNWGLDDL